MTIIPAMPNSTPTMRAGVAFSSRVRKCAVSTPHRGVVALRTEAKPLSICVWPQKNRMKGNAALIAPSANNCRQLLASVGSFSFRYHNASNIGGTASAIRRKTRVLGGNPRRPSSIRKNAPPQSTDSSRMMPQSAADILGELFIKISVRPEPVEGSFCFPRHFRKAGLRQAQPERFERGWLNLVAAASTVLFQRYERCR